MIKVTITLDTNDDNILGIKESITNDLEKYGDIKSVNVEKITGEQLKFQKNL